MHQQRLTASSSPYLRQHAHNPVDWWPWCDEAFEEARRRDVPVFLSVGYAACHWCHVMAHESFEDTTTAALLNDNFVSIKVDREERPDIDNIYMQATLAMTGQGGWPMSVFLNHDRQPFHAGTYFPPEPRHGHPSFAQVLEAVVEAWRVRRVDVDSHAASLSEAISERSNLVLPRSVVTADVFELAAAAALGEFDELNGGFGNAPKFPPSPFLRAAIVCAEVAGGQPLFDMAEVTLERMARGGLYDQLGGGFSRYCVDAEWVVPHFEKMLYDNAQLLEVYSLWFARTNNPLARRIAAETADFMIRELQTVNGGFASSLDADSEGVEGKFYVWSQEEFRETFGDDAMAAAVMFNVSSDGTFEHGLSTLQLLVDPEDEAEFESWRQRLFEARSSRVRPERDDKVITSWNGLAIAALAKAGVILEREDLIAAATAAADFILSRHLDSEGQPLRASLDGVVSDAHAVLDDFSHLAYGLLTLHQVTGRADLYLASERLLESIISEFADADGTLFEARAANDLIARLKQPQDGAEPSGWFMAAEAMLQFAALSGEAVWRARAEVLLRVVGPMARHPRVTGTGLAAAARLLATPQEVALVGDVSDPTLKAMRREVVVNSQPGTVFIVGMEQSLPLLKGRQMINGKATAYVCENFVCNLPAQSLEELRKQLA